ncbi:hypothetical protein AAFP32_08655 [Brevibacterium sp. CBA3109]|uniref:Uncharacterized protein n=1 Tax=Brevibacterium koreense TaxID=3140787 RepID=A0AAU7UGC1_9MICO
MIIDLAGIAAGTGPARMIAASRGPDRKTGLPGAINEWLEHLLPTRGSAA